MNNYRFTISYDGTRYYGWEHQPNTDMTIQGKLENVLSRMEDREVEILGAGRTDAGVHALGMVAHARLNTDMSEEEIRDYMNRYLPEDICVREVKQAGDRFHARYNALGKTYRYSCYIGDMKPLFDRKYVYTLFDEKKRSLNIKAMREAAEYLMGEHDFASFCSNPRMKKSTVRTVDKIAIEEDGEYLRMTFHGNGFLQHMVRILSGTLLEVGYGDRSAASIPALIEAKDRKKAGFTAPAQGLTMVKVDYH